MKYHLGCGSQYLEGYVNVDFPIANHNVNFNIKADLYTDILKMRYENCDEIRSHHFFEHFNYYETFIMLFKWTKILNINGLLIIDIPDLEELCRAYICTTNINTKFLVARYLFGSHEGEWAYHINGWSKDTLEHVLKEIGYSIQNIQKYGDFSSNQPNCGLTITAELYNKLDDDELSKKLNNLLVFYKNGDAEFENNLCEYFIREFENGIKE